MLILDNREHGLIRTLVGGANENIIVKQLDVGDAHILGTDDKIIVIAERKSVADLESSLSDGRYREQRTRILATCAETQAKPLYIIEGPLDRLNGRKTIAELWKVLNRLAMRYGISIIQTDDTAQTAEYLKTLHEQILADPKCFDSSTIATSYNAYVKTSKKETRQDPGNFFRAVIMQCPGVSAAVADVIVNHYSGGIESLMVASMDEIAGLQKAGGRKIGKAVSERLHGLLHYKNADS